jgi:hypothetical protein
MVKIDIPMPKTCKDCPIIVRIVNIMPYDIYWCPLPHENPGMWSFERSSKERMPTCPLIEVKDDD